MAPSPRVNAAFQAMMEIGIPKNKTKPALKKLLQLFNKNWDLIEEENYRVLADAIFEYEDSEAAEKEKKKSPPTDQGQGLEEEAQMQDEPERPLKRLRLKHQGQAAPSHGQPSPSSGTYALKIPKPEPGEPDVIPNERVHPMTGSPPSNAGNRRTESQPVSPQSLVRNKGKQPMTPQNMGVTTERPPHGTQRDNKAAERVSKTLQIKESKNERGIIRSGKQKQPEPIVLIKPKDEPCDDMLSLEPLAVVLPERSHPKVHSNCSSQINKPDGQQPGVPKSVDGADKAAGTLASPPTKENHLKEDNGTVIAPANIDIAASSLGEVKICLSCSPGPNLRDFHVPDLQTVFKKVEDNCIKTYKVMNPEFTVTKIMRELCESVLECGSNADGVTQEKSCPEDARVQNPPLAADSSDNAAASTEIIVTDVSNPPLTSNCQQTCIQNDKSAMDDCVAERDTSSVADLNKKSLVVVQQQLDPGDISCVYDMSDITRGEEAVKVSLEKSNCEFLPSFHYIAQNVVSHKADVTFSLAQIGEQDCCGSCQGDCLSFSPPCNCALRNGGKTPYTSEGLVQEELLEECISVVRNPQKHNLMYCKECPLERIKNEDMLDPCKGHLKLKFIKECWTKCGCSKFCGNRVVQRGIRCNLQVFWTPEGKGWGLRTLEDLPKGTFVCEYVGEILTISELHKRNLSRSNDKHSYSVLLDTDWGSRALKEEEVLCLDATSYGNVARFINHRCSDANLIEIPVELETPDHHYFHVALFTTRKIAAFEELTRDYGVDFDDSEHHIKAFNCLCGSEFCRNMKRSSRSRHALTLR